MSEEFREALKRKAAAEEAALVRPTSSLSMGLALFEAIMFVGEALLAVTVELQDVNRSLGAVAQAARSKPMHRPGSGS